MEGHQWKLHNTSRPVGCKKIPHLCVDKFGANNKLLQDSSTHFILSEAARVSLVLNHHTLHDSSTRSLSYKGFNLIKVHFSAQYSIVHVYFINCFNDKLYRETLPVAPIVRFTASAVMMWPICYSDTFFNFRPWGIQQIVCQVVAYQEVKNNWNF